MNLIGWKIGLVMYLAVFKSLRIKRTKETYACDRSRRECQDAKM
jgi:hypothetical protein